MQGKKMINESITENQKTNSLSDYLESVGFVWFVAPARLVTGLLHECTSITVSAIERPARSDPHFGILGEGAHVGTFLEILILYPVSMRNLSFQAVLAKVVMMSRPMRAPQCLYFPVDEYKNEGESTYSTSTAAFSTTTVAPCLSRSIFLRRHIREFFPFQLVKVTKEL